MTLDSPQVRGGGTSFDSPITSDKSGVNVNVNECQDQRSTNTDGDPTMLNGIPRAGNSAVDVIPTMTNTVRGIAKLGWGLNIRDDAIRKTTYTNPLIEYANETDGVNPSKLVQITINGDANTYYPVAITFASSRETGTDFVLGCYRYLGEPCNSSYPGNHDNGTSSLILILRGRSSGWDGNCNRMNVEQFQQPYANLVADINQNASSFTGIVIWLRGGGTQYNFCSNYAFNRVNVHYTRTDLGYGPYNVWVEPTTTVKSTNELLLSATIGTYRSTSTLISNNIHCSGDVTAAKVYNAVWNDYAELFERGSKTEPGDLIAIDTTSSDEKYVLANEHTFNKVVGVHSDEYGHLIGGENPKDGSDFLQYNLPRFIPVGLSGRVRTKVVGTCKKGDYLVASSIDGVARKYNKETDDSLLVFGMACEDKNNSEIERIKVYLK